MELANDEIKTNIHEIRDVKVMLDSDLAKLYQVETKRINEAVKNNPDKFPTGYILELSKDEWDILKSKYSTSKRGGKVKVPNAFTEKGLYMLATILKSVQATETTIAIIDTFTKLRELSYTMQKLSQSKSKSIQRSMMDKTGDLIGELLYDDFDDETKRDLHLARKDREKIGMSDYIALDEICCHFR